MRLSVTLLSPLLLVSLACSEWIAPVQDTAQLCIVDSDCSDTFFCQNGRCLRSSSPRCGDGVIGANETCDDGNRVDSDGCVDCRLARCGDAFVQLGVEACDEGDGVNANDLADRCRADCNLARCGDGTVDTGEACDDGIANSIEVADRCRIDCTSPRCGDGVIDSGEACDDANSVATDGCSDACQQARCGDGLVRTDLAEDHPDYEHCDDGNTVDDDDCDRYCGRGIVASANTLYSTCVARHHGAVWCWGQIADQNDHNITLRPIKIAIPDRIVELVGVTSENLFWGRSDQGKVYAWSDAVAQQVSLGERQAVRLRIINTGAGVNAFVCTRDGVILKFNYLGTSSPQVIQGPAEGMIDCAVAGTHNSTYCAWTPERRLYCWGNNSWSQLGDGTQQAAEDPQPAPIAPVLDFTLRQVGDGLRTCALDDQHDLHCWGSSVAGIEREPVRIEGLPKLGALDPAWRLDTGVWLSSIEIDAEGQVTFVEREHILRPRSVSHSYSTRCVTDAEFRLWCAGDDRYGTSGVGRRWRYHPVKVAGLDPVSSLALGQHHACAQRREDGQAYCWGGTADPRYTYTARGVLRGVRNGDPPTWVGESIALDSGRQHSCLITPEQSVRCWGNNRNPASPVHLGDGWQPDQISVGGNHQCVLVAGDAWCWGDNEQGESGRGDLEGSNTPERVAGLPSLAALSLGDTHSCALSQVGEVWCWGDNQYGQVGAADQDVAWIPQRVDLPFAVAQLSAGADHNCVRAVAGTVHCWGGHRNATGYAEQLDVDWQVIQPRNPAFEPVPGITNASWVSSGDGYGCALLSDSAEVVCWAGQLSLVTGSRGYEGPEPRSIPDLPPIERVDAGSGYACAITPAGETWCWGDNSTNQLGDDYPGSGVQSYSPVDRLDLQWGDGE